MWFQRVVFIVLAFVAVLGPCSMVASGTLSQDASDLLNRATADFLSGRIERSVAGFDQVVELFFEPFKIVVYGHNKNLPGRSKGFVVASAQGGAEGLF